MTTLAMRLLTGRLEITAFSFLALALVQPITAQAQMLSLKHRSLTPSEISTALSALDAEVPAPAQVYVSASPRYDDFFLRAAKVHGAFVLADSVTSKFGQALSLAANGAFEVPLSDPSTWPDLVASVMSGAPDNNALTDLERRGEQLEMLVEIIPPISENVGGLAGESTTLVDAAGNDFSGWGNKLRLAKTLNSLRITAAQLAGDGQRAARTLAYLKPIAAAVRKHLASGIQGQSHGSPSSSGAATNRGGQKD